MTKIGDRYILDPHPIGQGGMGEVFRATDERLGGRAVAVKKLARNLWGEERGVERLRREAELQAKISDKRHIVEIHDVLEDEWYLYVVMEHVEGKRSLHDVIAAAGAGVADSLTLDEALRCFEQACLGLRAIHSAGIIHGDVKGRNFFMTTRGVVKIGDFGLSRLSTHPDMSTRPWGTARTMAPEVYSQRMTDKSDIYSLGFTFYELLVGQNAFETAFKIQLEAPNAPVAWMRWHTDPKTRPTPAIDLNPLVPAGISQLLAEMMEKDEAQRPAIDEVVQRLRGERPRGDGYAEVETRALAGADRTCVQPGKRSAFRWYYPAGALMLALIALIVYWKVHSSAEAKDRSRQAESAQKEAEESIARWRASISSWQEKGFLSNDEGLLADASRKKSAGDSHFDAARFDNALSCYEQLLSDGQLDFRGLENRVLEKILDGAEALQKRAAEKITAWSTSLSGWKSAGFLTDDGGFLAAMKKKKSSGDGHIDAARYEEALACYEDLIAEGSNTVEGLRAKADGAAQRARQAAEESRRRQQLSDLRAEALGLKTELLTDYREYGISHNKDFLEGDRHLTEASGAVLRNDLDGAEESYKAAKSAFERARGHGEGEKEKALAKKREEESQQRGRLLNEGFRFDREETFSCGGQTKSIEIYIHKRTGLEFVIVPGGNFKMGSPPSEVRRDSDEGPQHPVEIKPFLLCRTECTQFAWDEVGGNDDRRWSGKNLPIESLSWEDATRWCRDAGGLRLPSESEWEYACRAGTDSLFCFGDTAAVLYEYGNYCDSSNSNDWSWRDTRYDDGFDKTATCGSYKPNAFGLYDMHGNVWEWCEDTWHDSYDGVPADGQPRTAGASSSRVYRGGSWSHIASGCRSAYRGWSFQSSRFDNLGFRPAFSLPDTDQVHSTGKNEEIINPTRESFNGKYIHRKGPESTNQAAQRAVEWGLDWLKRHQDPEGFWDADAFDMQCADTCCAGKGQALNDVGVTGLALLAFLGAGNTVNWGPYRNVVKKGVKYLCDVQDPEDGCLVAKEGTHWMYNHALACLALTEAYGLSKWPILKKYAQRALDYVHKSKNPGKAWRYNNGEIDPVEQNDVSVTAWMIMCLVSAEDFKLRYHKKDLEDALHYLDEMTDTATGRTGYKEKGGLSSRTAGDENIWPFENTEAMTAAAMLCRVLAGNVLGDMKSQVPSIEAGAVLLRKRLPEWYKEKGCIDYYYWYYGSYAMFQLGGTDWQVWKTAMEKAIIDNQLREGCERGSWDPRRSPWSDNGGRVYATALCTLSLEVYYRFDRVLAKR